MGWEFHPYLKLDVIFGGSMLKYTLKRLGQSFITLFLVITVVFLLLRLMPIEGYFDDNYEKLDEQQREAVLSSMGLTDPIPVQLVKFYGQCLRLDLGKSIKIRPNVKIAKIIVPKIGYSVKFGLASVALSLLVGVPMGAFAAGYKGKWPDKLANMYIVFINAVPAAVYYLFIQLYGSSIFGIPMLYDETRFVTSILPAISMSLGGAASYALWMRRYMVDELNKDYIRLARAKGLSNNQVTSRHIMKNAFVPMAQYLPSSILFTISGSLYIEGIYSIPGMGGLLITAIQRQDNTLVQALVIIFSSIGIVGLFLGDILMAILDPRIKLNRKKGAR